MTNMSLRSSFSPHVLLDNAPVGVPAFAAVEPATPFRRISAIRSYLAARAGRGRFFNPRLFADPAWDMLLELYVASLAQRRLQVSRLTERSGVPMTTALRWITALEREGLVVREADQKDARCNLLSLSDKGRRAMDGFFAELPPSGGLF